MVAPVGSGGCRNFFQREDLSLDNTKPVHDPAKASSDMHWHPEINSIVNHTVPRELPKNAISYGAAR